MTNFKPNPGGVCVNCGRHIGWHAGTKCFLDDASGVPAGATEDQLREYALKWMSAASYLAPEGYQPEAKSHPVSRVETQPRKESNA